MLKLFSAVLLFATAASAAANHGEIKVADFAPYAYLIGEWDIHEQGSAPVAINRASWGGGGTSIRLETDILVGGKAVPHYEGILVWNPIRRDFDMLLNLDPVGAKVQEKGRVWAAPDGTVTRDIVASYAPGVMGPDGKRVGDSGAEFTFRQTFRKITSDRMATSMMRQTANGWVATFPGSEEIFMSRRLAN